MKAVEIESEAQKFCEHRVQSLCFSLKPDYSNQCQPISFSEEKLPNQLPKASECLSTSACGAHFTSAR